MADEQKANPNVWMRVTQHVQNALWQLLDPLVSLALLAVATAEILSAPLFGTKWSLYGLSTVVAAIGFAAVRASVGVQWIGNLVQRIQRLYDEEVKKVSTEPQRRAAPEPPLPSWRN